MVLVYWSHWTNFYHHNAPLPELISHATAQLLDCKGGGNLGNSFLPDNATVAELLVPLELWSLFQQLWPLIAKCRSAWPPHSVVINCICSLPSLQIWPSLKSDRTFTSRMINQSVSLNLPKSFQKRDWSNFLLSNRTIQRLLFRDRSAPVGATLPEAFFSLVPAWLSFKGSQDVRYFCWLL